MRAVEIAEIKNLMAQEATSAANIEVEKYKREINDLQITSIAAQSKETQLQAELEHMRNEMAALKLATPAASTLNCCPTPGCMNSFNWTPYQKLFCCNACNRSYCLSCVTVAHDNTSCEENQRRFRHPCAGQYGLNMKMCSKCHFLAVLSVSHIVAMCPNCRQVNCYGCGRV